jgi:hypothetical protein
MHVVAVTRWGSPLPGELPELAARLGMVAYDLRLRLAGGLPAVFAQVEEKMEAAGHVEFLRARGHGAVACDAEAVPGPEDQIVPVDFEPTATALRGTCTRGRHFELPFAEILAIVHAACVTSSEHTVTTQEKKFAPGRAVLSGGMVLRKKVDRVDKAVTQEQEQMIYMFCRSHPAPYVWKELTLRYQGLGDRRQLTTMQNFATLSKRLRTLVPHAFHDQRLLTHKRRADISVLAGSARDRRLETSNAGENDLAVFLLVRGYLESQL